MNIRFILLTFLSFTYIAGNTQSYFSIVPDFGGDDMEGQLFNVIPLENDMKIIGLVHDSLVPGFEGGNWPILGSVSYNGEYQETHYLTDSMYSTGFTYFTRRIAFKNDSICYLYDRRDLGGETYDSYLVELNYRLGKILRTIIINDEISDHRDFTSQAIALGKNGIIYLVNITTEFGVFPQILTVLDSSFNILSQSLIPDFNRDNFTLFMEEDINGNLIMVGVSLGDETSVWYESKLFRHVLDINLSSVEFALSPTEIEHTIVQADSYPVIKSKNGDWVFATQQIVETNDCPGCSIWVPYLVSISNDFTEVLWETRMFNGDISSSQPMYMATSITEVSDGFIFAGITNGEFGIETSGLLGKVNLNGDSLWMKHYIPVGWDTVQGRWFLWKDIKTTPYDNIVVGGYGSDRYTSSIVPWILHLDKDGCIEPGCNITSTSEEDNRVNVTLEVFPNPAGKYCNIHIQTDDPLSSRYRVNILNDQGIQVHTLNVPGRDVQYMVDLERWPSGIYVVQLTGQSGKQWSKILVVVH